MGLRCYFLRIETTKLNYMKSAKEYWKDRFGEYPQNDADRLAVTMMMEYYHDITKDEVVKNNIVKPDVSGRSELLKNLYLRMIHPRTELHDSDEYFMEEITKIFQ